MRMKHYRLLSLAVAFLLIAANRANATEEITPLLLAVHDAPVPFIGSDGYTHLVYELWMTNYSSSDATVQKVEVLDGNNVLATLDAKTIAGRLQPAGTREPVGTMAKSTQALLFLHIRMPKGATVPAQISHRVTGHFSAAPPGHQEIIEMGGQTKIDRRSVIHIGAPLRGENYISADACCDASRHTRASLPVDGRAWIAQRFAVDWEQLNAGNHIYSGPSETLGSYTIFGKQVFAVADATVESVVDGQPEQIPGHYPTNIPISAADGNSVVLKLGEHAYGLYAHMQPGSIRVRKGDQVKRGQVIGLVGNTGNSVAPHLHFHVMDGPSPLASNGLPYEIDSFTITAKSPGTSAFDEAEGKGVPLAVTRMTSAQSVKDVLPLDQLIINFPSR
jgi:hypothetical protein